MQEIYMDGAGLVKISNELMDNASKSVFLFVGHMYKEYDLSFVSCGSHVAKLPYITVTSITSLR